MSNLGHKWYRVYRHQGRPDELASGLAAYVRNRGLSDNVVSLSLEKRPGKEFYYILGLVTDSPLDLGSIEDALESCPLLRGFAGTLESPDEFKSFTSGELRLTTLGQTIQYRVMQRETLEDPFDDEPVPQDNPEHCANELLWYLSTLGKGSWAQLQRACAALGMDSHGDATRMARTLRVLGHIELSPDGTEWSVNPALKVSARAPTGTLTFITGARTARTSGNATRQRFGPDRITIDGEAEAFPAEQLACNLPGVRDLIAGYSEVGHVDPYNNRIQPYGLNGFSNQPFKNAPGFYRVTTPSDRTIHLLLDADGTWRSGDWYSLRFFHLAMQNLLIEAEYDSDSWQLAIMADQRPPEAFERALVLASGLMPILHKGWLRYQNISPQLAEAVASRLQIGIRESVS